MDKEGTEWAVCGSSSLGPHCKQKRPILPDLHIVFYLKKDPVAQKKKKLENHQWINFKLCAVVLWDMAWETVRTHQIHCVLPSIFQISSQGMGSHDKFLPTTFE